MSSIKAIETVYNGYRFRSRLEARWAVFFDTLDIHYQYEKEGYELDGVRYLPDFWLPRLEYWIEVKPTPPPTELEMEKAKRLALASHHPVFFVFDIPQQEKSREGIIYTGLMLPTLWGFTPTGPDLCVFDDGALLWTLCPTCNKIAISLWGGTSCDCYKAEVQKEMSFYDETEVDVEELEKRIGKEKIEEMNRKFRQIIEAKYRYQDKTPRLIAAYTAARQARFEHGEKGIRP